MKIVRSILGFIAGVIVAWIAIFGIEMINFAIYRPDNGRSMFEQMKAMEADPKEAKAVIEAIPMTGMVAVLVAWQIGAFVGGAVSALITGRGRLFAAGLIGGFVLLGTIVNALSMKNKYDFTHPDWMIVAGLLLPIPVSLLAGKLVSMLLPPSPPPVSSP